MSKISLGVSVEGGIGEAAQFEELGADMLWAPSHLASPVGVPDGIVGLAQLSALSTRARIGISAMVLPLYQPAVIAKQLADIDVFSGGRVVLGVGVGGEFGAEFRAVGVAQPQRGARANEAIEVLRKLWTGEEVTHRGRFFDMERVKILPKPKQQGGPPVIVAGRKPPAMRRAAELGDGWFPYLYSPERYARSVEEVRGYAAAAGRDLSAFEWHVLAFIRIGRDGDQARRQVADELAYYYGQDFLPMVERVTAAGTQAEVTARLQAFVDAGARHLNISLIGSDRLPQLELLVNEIIPALSVT